MAQLGELRNEYALDLQRKVVKVIDDNQHRDEYYLLVHSNIDRLYAASTGTNAIKTTFIIFDVEPVIKECPWCGWMDFFMGLFCPNPACRRVLINRTARIIGTKCYKINNRKGKIERLWSLPLDIPRDPSIVTDETIDEVAKSSRNLPIVH